MVFNKLSKKFQESFKKVSRVFQESFKVVSRKIEGCLGDFSGFQGNLNEVQGNFKGVKVDRRVFQEFLKGMSMKYQECFDEVSSMFEGSFKDVSRKF